MCKLSFVWSVYSCVLVPLCVCVLEQSLKTRFCTFQILYHYDHTIPIYYTIKIKTPDSTCKSDLQLMLPTADSSFSVGHRELATRATHSGTWTAVNSPLSMAASRLQTETQIVYRRVLTHWLSYGPCTGTWTAVNILLSMAVSHLKTETQNVYRRMLTHWLSYGPCTVYLDCCQHPVLHGCFPSTNRNTKRLQKSADTLTELWAMQCIWTAVNIPLSITASHLQIETRNINRRVLTHWATGQAVVTTNSPFSTAASSLQTETQKVNKTVLTTLSHAEWYPDCCQHPALHCRLPSTTRNTKHQQKSADKLSHGLAQQYLHCSPLSSPIYKQKHKTLTELSHAHWYLDCCQQSILHCYLPSTNRNTKHLEKSADKLSHELYCLNCPQQCCPPPSQMYRK